MTAAASSRNNLQQSGGCYSCDLRRYCGGLDGLEAMWGCFTDCLRGGCVEHGWTCARCNGAQFVRRWRSVGGFPPVLPKTLRSPEAMPLPLYVPLIHHGSSRLLPIERTAVALPTWRIVGRRRDRSYGTCVDNEQALRAKFGIGANAKILAVSTGFDDPLELYWSAGREANIEARLAQFGFLAMTTPNYSFFDDAPRPHTLWNRQRTVRVAEELSAAGVPVVVHVNAQTQGDWSYWTQLLKGNPEIRYVSKEFQTGNKDRLLGHDSVLALRDLQRAVGRALHPIAIGGAQYVYELAREFQRFTIVDSEPFIKTMRRLKLTITHDEKWRWLSAPTETGSPLDRLFAHNLRRYEHALNREAARAAGRNIRQLALAL